MNVHHHTGIYHVVAVIILHLPRICFLWTLCNFKLPNFIEEVPLHVTVIPSHS